MRIKLVVVGKIKEPYLKDGINHYLTRIKPYAQIEVVELMDEEVSHNPKDSDILLVKEKEGEKILKSIKDNEYVINLDLNKEEMDSVAFASFIDKSFVQGGSSLTFVIGGSYGLSEAVKKRANYAISLSKMTFLHQMTRLILLEQIYRAFKILRNETYHK